MLHCSDSYEYSKDDEDNGMMNNDSSLYHYRIHDHILSGTVWNQDGMGLSHLNLSVQISPSERVFTTSTDQYGKYTITIPRHMMISRITFSIPENHFFHQLYVHGSPVLSPSFDARLECTLPLQRIDQSFHLKVHCEKWKTLFVFYTNQVLDWKMKLILLAFLIISILVWIWKRACPPHKIKKKETITFYRCGMESQMYEGWVTIQTMSDAKQGHF